MKAPYATRSDCVIDHIVEGTSMTPGCPENMLLLYVSYLLGKFKIIYSACSPDSPLSDEA